jgi:hypothetical protein
MTSTKRPSLFNEPDLGLVIRSDQNELRHKLLCKTSAVPLDSATPDYAVPDPEGLDIVRVSLPVNLRYSLTVYDDASFAIGALKQSISGHVIYLNGTPLLWGSSKQTIVVDSTCYTASERQKYDRVSWLHLR